MLKPIILNSILQGFIESNDQLQSVSEYLVMVFFTSDTSAKGCTFLQPCIPPLIIIYRSPNMYND